MSIVDFLQRRRAAVEGRLGSAPIVGITIADVLRVFPGAKIVPRKSEFEIWMETLESEGLSWLVAEGVSEIDIRAITEEKSHTVWKDGKYERANKEKPESACCSHCDEPHVPGWRRGGRMVRVIEADGTGSSSCQLCGRRQKKR
jgi:hypothetical protein